jgi:serine kinase of HPr protein (carbohydrate metabolism regulator)
LRVSFRQILEEKSKPWRLALISGEKGLDREITRQYINRPGIYLNGKRKFYPQNPDKKKAHT